MYSLKFTSEDFETFSVPDHENDVLNRVVLNKYLAEYCNKILEKNLDKAPTVYALPAAYCKHFKQSWRLDPVPVGKSAKLVCVEDFEDDI